MKLFLITPIIFLVSTAIFGQTSVENDQDVITSREHFEFPIIQNEVDEFEGTSKLLVSRLESWVLRNGSTKADLSVGMIDDVFVLNYYGTENCLVQGESKISLLLENKEVVDLGYYGDIDCSSDFRKTRFLFVNPSYLDDSPSFSEINNLQESNIIKILSSPVSKIRVYSSNGYSEYETYDVIEHLESLLKRLEKNIQDSQDDFDREYYQEEYSEFVKNLENNNDGAIFYKIPYDHYVPMDMKDMESHISTYLEVTLDSFDSQKELQSYYEYYRGNTKFVLMDMIEVLQNELRK